LSANFNPYREWLGITHDAPNAYELLGVPVQSEDIQAIASAADRAMTRVRAIKPGTEIKYWADLLDELKEAKATLTDTAKRNAYNKSLQGGGRAKVSTSEPVDSNMLPPGMGAPAGSTAKPESQSTPSNTSKPANGSGLGPSGVGIPQPISRPTAPSQSIPMSAPVQAPLAAANPTNPIAQPGAVDPMAPMGTSPASQPVVLQPAASTPVLSEHPATPLQSVQPGVNPLAQQNPLGNANPLGTAPVTPAVKTKEQSFGQARRRQSRNTMIIGLGVLTLLSCLGIGGYILYQRSQKLNDQAEVAQGDTPGDNNPNGNGETPATNPLGMPGVPNPVTPNPVVPNPTTPEPVDPEPVAPEPVTPEPVDPEPVTPEPVAPEPVAPEPTTPDPTPSNPGQGTQGSGTPDSMMPEVDMKDPFGVGLVPPSDPTTPETPPEKPTITAAEAQELGTLLSDARKALTARDFPRANALLGKAKDSAKLPDHKEKVARVKQLTDLHFQFWSAVMDGLPKIRGGEAVTLGTTQFAIVEANRNLLVIRHNGQNKRYPTQNIPAGIARWIVEHTADMSEPSMRAAVGSIYAVGDPKDPKTAENYAKARQYWQEAADGGMNTDELSAVLTDSYDLTPND